MKTCVGPRMGQGDAVRAGAPVLPLCINRTPLKALLVMAWALKVIERNFGGVQGGDNAIIERIAPRACNIEKTIVHIGYCLSAGHEKARVWTLKVVVPVF